VPHLKEPQPRRLVIASGDHPTVIRADRHRKGPAIVTTQNHGFHRRGKVHSNHRFGQPLQLVTAKEMPDVDSARELEGKLKAQKNPRIALYLLGECSD